MKAMVTGGAGFIGSHIIDSLIKDGHKVVSIDNYCAGKKENIRHLSGNPNFTEVVGDVCDCRLIRTWMKSCDVIFHNAASKKNICSNNPHGDLDVNAKGTLNLLEAARDLKVKKFVHASTGSVYGEPAVFPQDENHPLNPVSYYGVSKLAGEKYAMVFSKLYDMDVTILRYFHVFGPRQDCGKFGGVVSIFIDRILKEKPIVIYGDGRQERSFTYVDDIVKINRLVAERAKTKGQVYNCASGIKVTIKELLRALSALTGKDCKFSYADWVEGDIKKFEISSEKIRNLGIEFTSFEEGLKKTIGSFRRDDFPFHIREYESYEAYLEHQKLKLNKGISWLKNYEKFYYNLLRDLLMRSKIDLKCFNALCIGARTGTEVEVFRELGSFAIGIDVNPGKNNKYVVSGDGSNILFPDKSIDIVYTNALDHFLKIKETISEIKRVLKSGGYFIFLIGSAEDSKKDEYGSTYWDSVNDILGHFKRVGFVLIKNFDVSKTKWFANFVIMKYEARTDI